jgi:hypothetical protein
MSCCKSLFLKDNLKELRKKSEVEFSMFQFLPQRQRTTEKKSKPVKDN